MLIVGQTFVNNNFLFSHIHKVHNLNAKEYYDVYLKKPDEGICLNCGKPTKLHNCQLGYLKYCSKECSGHTDKNPFRTEKFKKNKKAHDIKKFGCEFSTQNEEVKKKIKESKHLTSLKYLQENLKEYPYLTAIEHNSSNLYVIHCSKCNTTFEKKRNFIYNRIRRHQNVCPICCPTETIMSSSIFEKEGINFIKEIYKGTIKTNDRSIIKPKELDVYLPELKLAFEFDGKYFHADCRLFKPIDYIAKRGLTAKEIWENDKNKDLLCEKLNIKLVRIKEYDWLENKQSEMDKIYKYIIEYSNRGL